MSESSGLSQLSGIGTSIGDVFINLSAEYPVLLDSILIVLAAIGAIISMFAVFDVIKLGRRDTTNLPGSAIFWRMVAGASLIDLAFWTKVWTASLWSMTDPLDISTYVAGGQEDYTKTAIMAALGFMMLAGYVTLGRAYIMMSKLGYLSPESRSDLIGSIIARMAAGSLLVAALHVSNVIENSTGFNWIPN